MGPENLEAQKHPLQPPYNAQANASTNPFRTYFLGCDFLSGDLGPQAVEPRGHARKSLND